MRKILLFFALVFGVLNLDAAEFRTIKDMSGNTVKIPVNVRKIAALWHANNQIILILGGADKIITTTEPIKTNAWFAQIYPRIATLPASLNGNDIQIEELIKLDPDAIIVSTAIQRDELAKHGFNVFHASFMNYDDMKKSVRMTAEIIGDDAVQRAENFIAYLEANIARVRFITQNLASSERPKILHIASGSNLLRVDGTGSLINEWITLAGGINAIKKPGNLMEITIEEVIASDPDVIIVGGENSAQAVEKIYASPAHSGLKAVQNRRVYANPRGVFSWDRYGAETALQVLWAAKILHADKFSDIDMLAEAKNFYKIFMNYELSQSDFELFLRGMPPQK